MKCFICTYAIVLLVCIGSSCSGAEDNRNAAEFERSSRTAKELFLRDGNYAQAKVHYESALRAAEDMKWIDGIVMTKRALSEISTAKKDYAEAEVILNDAIEICSSNNECSSQQLAALYDNLIFLYLFWLKDKSKALNTIERVAASREKLSQSEDVDSILSRYREQMKMTDFEP